MLPGALPTWTEMDRESTKRTEGFVFSNFYWQEVH